MKNRFDWRFPDRAAQMRSFLDPPKPPPGHSFSDAVLNAIVFVALVSGVVFVVAVLIGLLG